MKFGNFFGHVNTRFSVIIISIFTNKSQIFQSLIKISILSVLLHFTRFYQYLPLDLYVLLLRATVYLRSK